MPKRTTNLFNAEKKTLISSMIALKKVSCFLVLS